METTMENTETITSDTDECCPKFDPSLWDNIEHRWENKLFLRGSVPEIFHMPLPRTYGNTITRMWKTAEAAGAAPDRKDFLLLAYDPSPFKGELYMAITREIPGADIVRLSGNFISKVFDGPYNKVPAYIRETNEYLDSRNKEAEKYYFYFAYCPKCAKKYGHNFVVALAQVKDKHPALVL